MAVAIPFIMVGMAVLGTVMSAQAQREQGEAAKDAADYNAGIARRNAQISLDQADRDAEAQGRDARRQLGAMRAGYGAAGITMEGSPLDVLEDTATTAELDRQNILYRGRIRALGFEDEAGLYEMSGENAASSGNSRATATLIGGLGNAASSAYGAGMFKSTPAAGYSGGRATNSLTGLRGGGV
jgi:hypothetical protein